MLPQNQVPRVRIRSVVEICLGQTTVLWKWVQNLVDPHGPETNQPRSRSRSMDRAQYSGTV